MAEQSRIRKTTITLLKLTVTIAVIVMLIGKLGWRDIVTTMMQASPWWLAGGLAVFLVSGWLGVIQWQMLLRNRGIPLPFGQAFKLYFVGLFFNNFVFGGIVGDAVKVASIRSQNGKGMAGFAATFLDRFAGLWAMCGFAVAGSLVLLARKEAMDGKVETAVIALLATFVLFAGIMAFLVLKPLQSLFFRIVDRVPFAGKIRVREIISEMLIEAHDMRLLLWVSLLSAFIQLLRIGVHAMTAAALGLLAVNNFQYFFIFVPVIAMLMTIPLPFGVREAAGGALFALAGFPTDAAFVMGFLASLVGLAASLLGGAFFVAGRTQLSGKRNENLDCRPAV